ncbi:hypothetical protein RBH26_14455 [Natronolimnohabitans sp. A-GB9]|uniref:hypothetical protein n=1 Tax=Natronolimnohabitans sp. A-GB9 TaxID=3069757 RepID=UPI0027B41B44|nr:hypothetical protein [Natronolimnohabitans sp. A-GB9]MDQ2051678.1 hypothetical protein [Natronolimnohabitans sp. A-GB9]
MDQSELDALHESILDKLAEGRATPSYLADQTNESRQLVSSRLRDLMMGGHVEKIHKGLYELQNDPRASTAGERVKDITSDGYYIDGGDLVGECDRIRLSDNDGLSFDYEIIAEDGTLVVQKRDHEE